MFARKPRFRMATLLLFVFLVCCFLAFINSVGRRQRLAATFVRDHGGYVVYEHRNYEYAWDNTGATENYRAEDNQPYPIWQQRIIDPNHYNSVIAVHFGHVLIQDMNDAKKFGCDKQMAAMGRDFENDGPIVWSFNDIDDKVFLELLRQLRRFPKLRYLGLKNSDMTDRYIQELGKFTELQEIQLDGCDKLSKEAVEQLQQKLTNCKITF